MGPTFAFLDTNTFLHYVPLDQVNWTEQLETGYVVLMVTPIVIRQLNKVKDGAGERKLKTRAASALSTLEFHFDELLKPRNDVEVRLIESEPLIDFSAHRLCKDVDDDWLIASILEFQSRQETTNIVLVTADVGLRLKAGAHKITTFRMPQHLLLPQVKDPNEIRLHELEKKIQAIETAQPKLSLMFTSGSNRLQFRLPPRPTRSEEDIPTFMETIRKDCPKREKPRGYSEVDLIAGRQPLDIDDYNHRVDNYYGDYQRYFRDEISYSDRRARTLKLNLSLLNDGGCPATDVDILLHFPDGFAVCRKDGLLTAPQKPDTPYPPMTPMGKIQQALRQMPSPLSSILRTPSFSMPDVGFRNVGTPKIHKTNSYNVEINVADAKHKFSVILEPLFVVFDSWDTTKSFRIDYVLIARNLPAEVAGALAVIVDKPNH